ncbi:unnamed protein product [Nesidiocoris tenuis]|uniref:Ig-like domain-containing protein n=1 Tax=Nesidiocoris tenuis TaxID=355587 RepID=A0A6H5GFG5_9HEMI|nr:unnamed protein product [Nesidiocoris tenuis]
MARTSLIFALFTISWSEMFVSARSITLFNRNFSGPVEFQPRREQPPSARRSSRRCKGGAAPHRRNAKLLNCHSQACLSLSLTLRLSISSSLSLCLTLRLNFSLKPITFGGPLDQQKSISMNANESKAVTVKCEVSGDPHPNVVWQFKGKTLPTDKPRWIHINSSEQDRLHETAYGYMKGVANITCQAVARPKADYTWTRNNRSLDNLTTNVIQESDRAVLQVQMIDESVLGPYECTANNSLGSIRKVTVRLTSLARWSPTLSTAIAWQRVTTLDLVTIRRFRCSRHAMSRRPAPGKRTSHCSSRASPYSLFSARPSSPRTKGRSEKTASPQPKKVVYGQKFSLREESLNFSWQSRRFKHVARCSMRTFRIRLLRKTVSFGTEASSRNYLKYYADESAPREDINDLLGGSNWNDEGVYPQFTSQNSFSLSQRRDRLHPSGAKDQGRLSNLCQKRHQKHIWIMLTPLSSLSRMVQCSNHPLNNRNWSRTIVIALLIKPKTFNFCSSTSDRKYFPRLSIQRRKTRHREGRFKKLNGQTNICHLHQACWSDASKNQNDSLPVTMMTELGTPILGLKKSSNNAENDAKQRLAQNSPSDFDKEPQQEKSSSECIALHKIRNDSRVMNSNMPIRPGRPSIVNYKETLEKLKRLGVLKKRQVNSYVGMTSPSSQLPNGQPSAKKKLSLPTPASNVQSQNRNKIMENTLAYKLEEYYKAREKDDLKSLRRSNGDEKYSMKWHRPPAYPCTSPSKSRYKNIN